MHSDVAQLEDDDIVGFPGKHMANDASLVAGIGDFRNDLPWLDSPVDPLRPDLRQRVRRQFDFERQRRLELAGFIPACRA